MGRASRRAVLLLALGAVAAVVAPSCGSSGDDEATGSRGGTGGEAGSGAAAGTAGAGGDVDAPFDGFAIDSESCPAGQPCGDGGVCAGGVCCDAKHACGASCCAAAEVCSFLKCVKPGADCADPSDCAAGEYCDTTLGPPPDGGPPADSGPPAEGGAEAGPGCQGGKAAPAGKCLPKPPECPGGSDAGAPDGGPLPCLEKCEWKPPASAFDPELKLAWGGQTAPPTATDVMMTPIVVQLDDDDCDGKVTANDIPEIVFTTFAGGAYTSPGTLHAISVVGGKIVEKWTVPGLVHAGDHLAGGDVDGKPGNEIVGCGVSNVYAFTGAGKMLWQSGAVACGMPAIADLDQDGKPEVVVEGGILDGATGALKKTFAPPLDGTFLVSDLDGDGKLDVVTATQGYHADGTQFVATGVTGHTYSGCASGYYFCSGPAIADFDKDGKPEVVAVYFVPHQLAIWRYDPTKPGKYEMVRKGIDINGVLNPALCPAGSAGSKWGGGPATVGDFNGDGVPDVALAGGVGYAVFDGKKLLDGTVPDAQTFLWAKQTKDCSSAGTGSSLFDFNGDGKAEVVYADEHEVRIYEGATGTILWETCNTSGTLNEYPVIADVDADGQADIVVASNAYSNLTCLGSSGKTSGVRIFGSKTSSWVRTRRVWNEHAYHITNVEEDGRIPKVEAPNYAQPGLDNFRLNKQPGSEFSAPDAIVSVAPQCAGPYGVVATVRNIGQAVLPAGVKIEVFAGTLPGGTKMAEGATALALYPAQAEPVAIPLPNAPPDVKNGSTPVAATVTVLPPVHECRTDNNASASVSAKCSGPN